MPFRLPIRKHLEKLKGMEIEMIAPAMAWSIRNRR